MGYPAETVLFMMGGMDGDLDSLLVDLEEIAFRTGNRIALLKHVADLLKGIGGCLFVGLYDVDPTRGLVSSVVWSGPVHLSIPYSQ
jgi:hypothetical protein